MEAYLIRLALGTLLVCSLGLAQQPAKPGKGSYEVPVTVARRFLPPNSQLEELYSFDYRTGRIVRQWPAVLTAHILSPESHDIVFAYHTPRDIQHFGKALFVASLHGTDGDYHEVYVASYQNEVLLAPKAIRILRLNGRKTDAVAVMHGIGAALGGRLDVYLWDETWGLQNVFPPHGGMDYVYFFPRPEGFTIALTSFLAKRPGLDVLPPPIWFRWNRKRFVNIPPPAGSTEWPIHDY